MMAAQRRTTSASITRHQNNHTTTDTRSFIKRNQMTSEKPQSVPLDLALCKKFAVSKRLESNLAPPPLITSLDYSDSGQYLVTTSIDETIQLYDTTKGKHVMSMQSKKYGCHLARFTHHEREVLYASTKDSDKIRYLSLNDKSYLRYFDGHRGLVTSLEVNPRADTFVSSSLDNTVKMWDLRSSHYQASVPYAGPTHLALDPSGQVLCISSEQDSTAAFFVMKTMSQFDRTVHLPKGLMWNKVEFSNDNKYILFSAVNGDHLILDAFEFTEVARLTGISAIPQSRFPFTGTASFSPDGKYVFSGNGQGNVAVWSLKPSDHPDEKLPKIITPSHYLQGDNKPKILAFNPRYMQFTTADDSVSMWIPNMD